MLYWAPRHGLLRYPCGRRRAVIAVGATEIERVRRATFDTRRNHVRGVPVMARVTTRHPAAPDIK